MGGGGLIWSIRPTGLVDEGFLPICHVTSYECYTPASISYFLVNFHVLSLLMSQHFMHALEACISQESSI